jgi:predicted dehydrogenase
LKGDQLLVDGEPTAQVDDVFREQAGQATIQRYFPQGIHDGFALELSEFLHAIEQGRQPETSGLEGLHDIAPCLAALESSTLNRPVKLSDVEECRIEAYQQEINAHWGIQ